MGGDDSGENCSVTRCEGERDADGLPVTTNCFLVLSHIVSVS